MTLPEPYFETEAMEWKDVTTYSRGDKERKPTTWEIKGGSLKIDVTCGYIHRKGEWIMHCFAVGIDTYHLKYAETKEQAQEAALRMVRTKIQSMLEDIDAIIISQL